MSSTDEPKEEALLAPSRSSRILLPEGYYLEHFKDFLAIVESTYARLLNETERRFLDDFRLLSEWEQRLFVRMANRTGEVFLASALRYSEIPELPDVLHSLIQKGFLRRIQQKDFPSCLLVLSKDQLLALAEEVIPKHSIRSSWKKQRLLEEGFSDLSFESFSESQTGRNLVVVNFSRLLRFFSFLAFRNLESGTSLYTLRDLGIRRSNAWERKSVPRFVQPDDARSEFFYSLMAREIDERGIEWAARQYGDASTWEAAVGPGALIAREKCIWKFSEQLIREGQYEQAIQYLEKESSPRCAERRIRLLHAKGRSEESKAELEAILRETQSADLRLFAEDFRARKFGKAKIGLVSRTLREAVTISVDAKFSGAPERGLQNVLLAEGQQVYRTENHLWLTLFGLLFWEELFESETAAIHSEFERIPGDLLNATFYLRNREKVDEKLFWLKNHPSAYQELEEKFTRHYGTLNGVFQWKRSGGETLQAFLQAVSLHQIDLSPILLSLAEDFQTNKKGFPDLFVLGGERPKFLEVKTVGDSLQRIQLRQLQLLAEIGFHTGVVRVEWEFHPEQTYVVVDLETTGGVASYERVTEIGAVKLQGNQIVERYSRLVNPQKRIPRHITELTGISNEMVEHEPTFAELAPEFREFLGDAIFVAHNAPFDFGFLSAEYRRLGESFRVPVFCTRTWMRRKFPGLPSYSLKNLCRTFGISLDSHHRALCDAEAAAGLWLEILGSLREEKERALRESPQGNSGS